MKASCWLQCVDRHWWKTLIRECMCVHVCVCGSVCVVGKSLSGLCCFLKFISLSFPAVKTPVFSSWYSGFIVLQLQNFIFILNAIIIINMPVRRYSNSFFPRQHMSSYIFSKTTTLLNFSFCFTKQIAIWNSYHYAGKSFVEYSCSSDSCILTSIVISIK